MSQITIDDMMYMEQISAEPSRTAYIDECGSFGFDFTKSGNSKYYLICAIIVKDENIPKLHDAVKNIKQQNGFQNTELKSSSVGNSYNRRNKIFYEFLQIDFKAIVLIANKEEFVQGSPLTEYKPSFIKFLHQRLYDMLYRVYHPQYMEIDSAVVKMVLIKYKEQYLRVIKASVRGLRTCADINRLEEEWIALSDGFWGHPGVLSSTKDGETYVVCSNLYMKEKEYATKEEALAKFYADEVCLDCLCEDVFGNG